MDYTGTRNRVEVIDRDGWRKEYTLDRAILHIGSDTRNDIVLEGGRGAGVEARHAQLISAPGSRSYRLVNLGQAPIVLDSRSGQLLPSRGAVELFDGDIVHIGEHVFRFHAGEGFSNAISVSLDLPDTHLSVDAVLEGIVTVKNLGDVPGAQFKLTLEGLSREWYQLGPGPILFPGVQKQVLLHLHHARQPEVPAGPHVITVRAKAPDAYPGESAAASQTVHVAPFYSHQVRLTSMGAYG